MIGLACQVGYDRLDWNKLWCSTQARPASWLFCGISMWIIWIIWPNLSPDEIIHSITWWIINPFKSKQICSYPHLSQYLSNLSSCACSLQASCSLRLLPWYFWNLLVNNEMMLKLRKCQLFLGIYTWTNLCKTVISIFELQVRLEQKYSSCCQSAEIK